MNSWPASAKERSGGGRITSDSSSSSSPSLCPSRAHELEHLLEDLVEAVLVAGLDRRDGRVVELVEALGVLVGQAVLVLRRDPDDHGWPPWALLVGAACPPRAPATARAPWPSSAFSFARSSSTCAAGRQLGELAVDVVLAGGEREVVVERAGGLELVHRARARAHVLGLVHRALHRQADVGHLLADAGRGLGDLHLRLGGRVLRLDDLLLGAELLELGAQLLLLVDQALLLLLELGDLLVERLQLGLGELLALERGAGEVLAARRRAPGAPACRA